MFLLSRYKNKSLKIHFIVIIVIPHCVGSFVSAVRQFWFLPGKGGVEIPEAAKTKATLCSAGIAYVVPVANSASWVLVCSAVTELKLSTSWGSALGDFVCDLSVLCLYVVQAVELL
jgi:hypothetical protein